MHISHYVIRGSAANKGSSLHHLFTHTSVACSSLDSSTSCSRSSRPSIPSCLFLSSIEILLSALMIKKLKRRQLPPKTLMCYRNNSSQSRPELQSVSGVPGSRNSSVCYIRSRELRAWVDAEVWLFPSNMFSPCNVFSTVLLYIWIVADKWALNDFVVIKMWIVY